MEPWINNASCRKPIPGVTLSEQVSWWYPIERTEANLNPNSKRALKICREECPVREECLEHSYEIGEYEGIWGGQLGRVRYRNKRNRPQKHVCEKCRSEFRSNTLKRVCPNCNEMRKAS